MHQKCTHLTIGVQWRELHGDCLQIFQKAWNLPMQRDSVTRYATLWCVQFLVVFNDSMIHANNSHVIISCEFQLVQQKRKKLHAMAFLRKSFTLSTSGVWMKKNASSYIIFRTRCDVNVIHLVANPNVSKERRSRKLPLTHFEKTSASNERKPLGIQLVSIF